MPKELISYLRELRQQGQLAQAQQLLARAAAERADPQLAHLAWQHEDFWWRALQGPRVLLRRRGPADAELVRRCFTEADFMRRFNRMAAPLPASDAALHAMLQREQWALAEETRALHWTIEQGGMGRGFVSVVDISSSHRRGEFLIGVLPGTGPWVAPEAAHLALEFMATRMQLERLTAYFYPDNPQALRLALKLGFAHEGVLRGYLRAPGAGRSDLVVAGLLLDGDFFARTARIRRRLLGCDHTHYPAHVNIGAETLASLAGDIRA